MSMLRRYRSCQGKVIVSTARLCEDQMIESFAANQRFNKRSRQKPLVREDDEKAEKIRIQLVTETA
jgi:hypothetical protein